MPSSIPFAYSPGIAVKMSHDLSKSSRIRAGSTHQAIIGNLHISQLTKSVSEPDPYTELHSFQRLCRSVGIPKTSPTMQLVPCGRRLSKLCFTSNCAGISEHCVWAAFRKVCRFWLQFRYCKAISTLVTIGISERCPEVLIFWTVVEFQNIQLHISTTQDGRPRKRPSQI